MRRLNLIDVYLDWVNNFVTIEGFAGYYGYTKEEARQLILLAKQVYESKHPEA